MAEKTKPCRVCGREFPKSELSHRGFCKECGIKRMLEANAQMRALKGSKVNYA